jgi:DNA helicase-2/ATP-dependent DNA helicase PcrA
VPSFFVLTEKVISLIAEQRPTDLRQLRDIPGVGQATVEQHGNTIIAIVRGQWV